ncbi:uncharacterized protein LOC113512064 [Galleria mellonella]|uniref:Uncharacterized protein LOC113512064 n=1 Tax=Galleria mellonella TaxID=7137 RepID=A0A6J3C2E3_GALME|nr:uncharacterized protein LOC113512064 [Galleria mellonella]
MASLQLEGDVDSLHSLQQQFLRDVLDKRGFKNNRVIIKTLGKAGDNFMANVKRITVEKEDGGVLNIVAKLATTVEITRLTMSIKQVFENERVVYQLLLPKFRKLQNEAGVPKEDLFHFPECYGALTEAPYEMILLEDLNVYGYVMLDKQKYFSDEVVKLVLKDLATYHALSFVLKQKEPAYYEDLKLKFFSSWSQGLKQEMFKNSYTVLLNDTISILDEDKYTNILKDVFSKMRDHDANVISKPSLPTNSIIQHGDAWTNNLLFLLRDEKPAECILIDYQMATPASPVNDLLFMIFYCTDYAARRTHYEDWISYYYSQLDRSLNYFGLRAHTVYPRDQHSRELKSHSAFILGLLILFSSMNARSSDEAAEMKDLMQSEKFVKDPDVMGVSHLSPKSLALFKSKVKGILDSYYDLGYI